MSNNDKAAERITARSRTLAAMMNAEAVKPCEVAAAIRKIDVAKEIEQLRAEVERLRADRDSWEQQASDRVADWHAEHLRAKRMEKALKDIRSLSSINSAMNPSPLALTVLLGDIHHIADAALAEENRNDQ